MSISNIIDPATRKFYPQLIPPPVAPVVPNLNSVLTAGNSAGSQTIENLDELETQKIYQGNYLQLELGESGDTVLLKGATPLGTLLVGNGLSIEKLPLGPNNSVLVADSGQPLGVKWANETGDVESVSAGTNITLTGTAVNPIVNLSNPLTSDLVLAPPNKLKSVDGFTTMEIGATGIEDVYLNGLIENKEDLAVSSLGVVETLSATDGVSYTNSYQANCLNTGISINTSALDVANNNLGTRVETTTPFSCLSTHEVQDVANSTTATRLETVSSTLGSNQRHDFVSPSIQAYSESQVNSTQSYAQWGNATASEQGVAGLSTSVAQAELGASYSTLTGTLEANTGTILANNTGVYMEVASNNFTTSQSHKLRCETPATGGAIIQHQTTAGTVRDLGISTQGNLTLAGDNIDLSTAGRLIVPSLASTNFLDYNPSTSTLELQQTTTGGVGNPMIKLEQQDTASGSANITLYKNTFSNGQTIGDIAFRAKTAIAGNPDREYAKISTNIRNNTGGNVDGSITFNARINDVSVECMRINGADSHIEIYQPLDVNDNDIITSTGDIELNATSSTGTGSIILTGKVGGSIVLDNAVLTLKNTNTTTSTPNHNASIQTTSNGVATNTFLKLKLGIQDIWIPYFTTDPSL